MAAQTLSSSVADALEYLCENNIEGFTGAEETVKFIRAIDIIFDFLNSRNFYESGYKQPITRNNIDYKESFIMEKIKYLFDLKADSVPMFLHSRRTFLLGFATAIKSVLNISRDLFKTPFYKFILTYNFSQDFLELFFGSIRMRFGCNNNPNILEFKYAMRRLLTKNYIQAGQNGNCTNFNENIGSIYSLARKNKTEAVQTYDSELNKMEVDSENKLVESDVKTLMEIGNSRNNELIDNILGYIAGFLVRKIVAKVHCDTCIDALVEKVQPTNSEDRDFMKLVTFKNRGGLVIPKDSVYKVVKKTEHLISILTDNFTNFSNINFRSVIIKNKIDLAQEKIFEETCNCSTHLLDVPHKIQLIEIVTEKYLNTRLYTQCIKQTLNLMKGQEGKRQFHSKLVLLNSL